MNRFYLKYFFVFIFLFIAKNASATHLRAGEITARKIPGTERTYRITLTSYHDEEKGANASSGMTNVTFYFGEGNTPVEVKRRSQIKINPFTSVNTYDTLYTFPANRTYKIGVALINRNSNTGNLPGDTEKISMWLETTLTVNASLGQNATPILLNIPIDTAAVGVRFVHNPNAFDPDGDSLAYRMTIPREKSETIAGSGSFIKGYQDPNLIGTGPDVREDGGTPASFSIDPVTGDLVWDAPRLFWKTPLEFGQVNVAFVIEEWRKGADGTYIKISETVRDMQIIVVETKNLRPAVSVPRTLCVEAGTKIQFTAEARDPDKNPIRLSSSSGVYNVDQAGRPVQNIKLPIAKFTLEKANPQASPAKGEFLWQTSCDHIRLQPYDVLFKAEDVPGSFAVQLVDIKSTKITVIAPRPRGLIAESVKNTIRLKWNKLGCSSNATGIIIYRKDGCSSFSPGECITGLPAGLGYKEIARVKGSDTTYVDNAATPDQIFSYRIVAEYSNGVSVSQSVVSNESCTNIRLELPVMTNVSITKTDLKNGEIFVRWTRPIKLNQADFNAPYEYRLYRAKNTSGLASEFALIKTFSNADLTGKTLDTVFVDTGLDTKTLAYRYKVDFFYSDNGVQKRVGETPLASSVRLSVKAGERRLTLNWEANVPWSFEGFQQKVYRQKPNGDFALIAEISGNSYVDDGTDRAPADGLNTISIKADTSYCYRIETIGGYTDTRILQRNLINFSQIECGTPYDTPCPPILTLLKPDCGNAKAFCDATSFSNQLQWTYPTKPECGRNIVKYKIYFATNQKDRAVLVSESQTLNFTHTSLPTLVGCYYVTAVNRAGLESQPSNIVCQDNCPEFSLPNTFTPNADGKNDVFRPLSCLTFLDYVDFEVYSRDGNRVYSSLGGKTLLWDGKNSNGENAPAGLYYYLTKVRFDRLERKDELESYKGWIELLR
jgi:gliding motility-associated-like protein